MTDPAPEDDVHLLTFVADTALATYADYGLIHPFGVLECEAGLMLFPTQGFKSMEDKMGFLDILRFMSIEHSGVRSAFAMESWVVASKDPGDMLLAEQITARGGSLTEHPKVQEAIHIIVESDDGVSTRSHIIVRDGDTVTLEPGEISFQSTAEGLPYRGLISNFHVPTWLQPEPECVSFANDMRERVTSHTERVTPSKGSTIN